VLLEHSHVAGKTSWGKVRGGTFCLGEPGKKGREVSGDMCRVGGAKRKNRSKSRGKGRDKSCERTRKKGK